MSNVLHKLEELTDMLEKAQIVRGGNSSVSSWAGSPHMKEGMPNNAPNGTDYKPAKLAKKSIEDMTNDEVEHYLMMRKSGLPNPRAAEEEIAALEGVTKSICPSCGGAGKDHMSKSMCGTCGGHGVVFECETEYAQQMAKSIADKYNVGDLSKAEKKDDLDAELDELEEAIDVMSGKAEKGMKKGDMKKRGGIWSKKGKHEDHDMEKMYMAMEEDDDEGMEKTKKSMEALNVGMRVLLKSLKTMMEEQAEQQELLNALANSHVTVAKSLTGSAPARGPLAQGAGLRVLEKGFVDMAPGGQQQYSAEDIKKGASQMVYTGELDRMEVLRMDAGVGLAPEVETKIVNWLNSNRK